MEPEKHVPMCDECKAQVRSQVVTPFTCKGCGGEKLASQSGDWHYCDHCAAEHSKCTSCGKDMPQ